jgi:hypothetical protein
MAWNLAFDHLCNHIVKTRLSDFNAQLSRVRWKTEPSVVSVRADLEDFKESRVLEIARGAGILSGAVYKLLKEKLDKRNTAAHPSDVHISPVAAEDVILDLTQNVVLKFT